MGRVVECLDQIKLVIEETSDSKIPVAWILYPDGKKGGCMLPDPKDSDQKIAEKLGMELKNSEKSAAIWKQLTSKLLSGAGISWSSGSGGIGAGSTRYVGNISSVVKTRDQLVLTVSDIWTSWSAPYSGPPELGSSPDETVILNRSDDLSGDVETGYVRATHYRDEKQSTKYAMSYDLTFQERRKPQRTKAIQVFPFVEAEDES